MVRTCCIPQCKSEKQVPFHKIFLKDPIRCHEWIKNLNLYHLKNMCANDLQKYKVCYKHFCEEDYSCSLHHRFLLNTAIPVLHISNNVEVNNVRQQSLQYLSKKDEQHSEVLQSMLTNISFLQDQVQQRSKRLSEQQILLEMYTAQQIELQNEVLEIQQKTNEKNVTEKNELRQSHYEQKDKEKPKNIIQDNRKRSQRIKEQLMTTPIINQGLRRRLILQNITCVKNLSPTAKMLYNTAVKLKRANARLKRRD